MDNSIVDFESFAYYLVVLILSVYFASRYERTNQIRFIFFSFITNSLFACLRFCVGNDYDSYASEFIYFSQNPSSEYRYEPAYYCLSLMFRWTQSGYLYIFAIEYLITYAILYKIFLEEKILSLGIFVSITLGFQILCFDASRQGVALAFFLYSIKYVHHGQWMRYLLCILCGAMFHISIVAVAPAYLIRYIKINKFCGIFGIVVSYLMLLTNKVQVIDDRLLNMMEGLGYLKLAYLSREEFQGGLGVMFKNLIGVIACLNVKCNAKYKEYFYLLIVGCIINNFVNGLFNLVRLADYAYYALVIVLPIVLKKECTPLIKASYKFLFFGYFIFLIWLGKNQHGATPYQTFFGKDTNHPERYVPLRRGDL